MKFINLKTGIEESVLVHPSVLCIGNFDGVHIGHRRLVDAVLEEYEILKHTYPDIVTCAWFFDSNFYKSVKEIFSITEKLDIFAELGLDYAIIAEFSEMQGLSPSEFVADILIRECKCVHAVCGENFRFGKKASGNSALLTDLMSKKTTVLPLLTVDSEIVSSTYIRNLLANGFIEKANTLLGSNYSIYETVVHGKKLGRKLGIPTVNQNVVSKSLIIKNGIYVTDCTLDGVRYRAVTNVGIRPTVDDNGTQNVETHIIGYTDDCYDKTVKIEFLSRIRDEMTFNSIDELKARINSDIEIAKEYKSK